MMQNKLIATKLAFDARGNTRTNSWSCISVEPQSQHYPSDRFHS